MQLEFVGQSARDAENPKAAPSRLVNCLSETSDGIRTIRPVLGVSKTLATEDAVPAAAEMIGETVYGVIGSKLYEVTATSAAPVATFDAVTDDTSISGNNGTTIVVTNGEYYTWDGTTLTEMDPGVFDAVTDVTFFAQRTILLEKDGRRLQWSALLDPTTFNGLDFATAETRDDNVLRALPLGGQLWIFKERSIEKWAPAGDGPIYIPGSTVDIGLQGRNLVTARPNGLTWIATNGKVMDSGVGILSTPAVESAIANGEPVSLGYYRDEGNEIVAVMFADRPAWCCNLSTGEWHERASGADIGAWTARRLVMADVPFSFAQSGGVDILGATFADRGGDTLHRRIVSRTLNVDNGRFRVAGVEFTFNTGEGASFLYRLSRDRGRTFGAWKQRSLGERGEYGYRAPLRALGQFRNLNIELAMTDPTEITVWSSATVEIV